MLRLVLIFLIAFLTSVIPVQNVEGTFNLICGQIE